MTPARWAAVGGETFGVVATMDSSTVSTMM